MKIQLSDHFTYKMLLRFVLPSIIMMVFTSIYGVVDGLFVSNFVAASASCSAPAAAHWWPKPWARATSTGPTSTLP